MNRKADRLRVHDLRRLAETPGRHFDGGGLLLQVVGNSATWVLRFTKDGRRRELGLGALQRVGLAEARRLAKDAHIQIAGGIDPIQARVERRIMEREARAGRITFEKFARQYVDDRRVEWKSAKHATQWLDSLDAYAKPIMKKPVAAITYPDVLGCLKPHWLTKTETASRVQGRISNIMDRAVAKGLRSDNPAKWDLLKHDLPSASALKRKRVKHFAALPVPRLPGFMARLSQHQGIAPLALEFLILTCARVNEVAQIVDSEIDLAAKVWKVPGKRMKSAREHTVPLCERALQILKTVPREKNNPFIFASGVHAGGHITNAALYKLAVDISDSLGHRSTVHGFRATFRTWASESTRFPHPVIELALAHTQPDPLLRAYQRSDLLAMRRKLAQQWATYALTSPDERKVVPLRRTR